ncbi:hypothetical protein LCGC14_2425850 [marine sediment metagenome]|uniref:Uncharacterized protein n=1 Tax=marine sediment metagenome TaxID=412755 RepID=A0A0F9EHH3_9ZZZZ
MAFKSKAQERFMYARHPRLAREFESKTPEGTKLPERVRRMGAYERAVKRGGEGK